LKVEGSCACRVAAANITPTNVNACFIDSSLATLKGSRYTVVVIAQHRRRSAALSGPRSEIR
jgi:hypothetical protein